MRSLHSLIFLLTIVSSRAFSQEDSTRVTNSDSTPAQVKEDTLLQITNLNPYITLHVDSTLSYKLDINKDEHKYYWYLRNAPVGLKIKDNGMLTFRAEKSYFLSGKLKYDVEYKVSLCVQNLRNVKERVDTFFTLIFYNTEIIPAKVKPTVSNTIYVDEGDTVNFGVQCETGSFPIETISTLTSVTIKDYTPVNKCGETFIWTIPFDFVKETDSASLRSMTVSFIGANNKFFVRDTATVKIVVKEALNYPLRLKEHRQIVDDIENYILQLKYAFRELDRTVKRAKKSRTSFDLTSGTSALGGTVFSTMSDAGSKRTATILPSVGVALIPVKEAVAPVKTAEQNSAGAIRTNIRRLEYTLTETAVVGDRDPDIVAKTKRLRDELKQAQVQLIDVPVDFGTLNKEELNRYFNSPKVNKKYRMKKR